MLDLMRRKKQTIVIKVVFLIIVLSFIGTMFLVWGKGSDGGGRSGGYAAKVDGSRISLEEYQNSYQRIRNLYQQIYGQSLSAEMEKILGLRKIALDNLIESRLVMKEARSMGIKISDDEVAKSIEAIPAFQKDGKFDFNLYQQLLRGSRITPKDFEAGQKEELMLQKARQSIKDKVTVSDEDALAQYRKENDKIDLEYVAYAPRSGRRDRRSKADRCGVERLPAEEPGGVQDSGEGGAFLHRARSLQPGRPVDPDRGRDPDLLPEEHRPLAGQGRHPAAQGGQGQGQGRGAQAESRQAGL